jgi:hypothetical protein
VPAACKRVERRDDALEPLAVADDVVETLAPVLVQRSVPVARMPDAVEHAGELLRALATSELPQPFATACPLVRDLLLRPERARAAARGELTEHRLVDTPLRLRHEVQQVVRQVCVESRRRMHHHVGRELALDEDAVAALARLPEVHAHARAEL